MIPILYNHDATKVIGSYHDGVFTLIEGQEITILSSGAFGVSTK